MDSDLRVVNVRSDVSENSLSRRVCESASRMNNKKKMYHTGCVGAARTYFAIE